MLKELEKIRFVAANYPQLQGLKMAVIGLFSLGIGVWTNTRQGDLSLPLVMLLLVIILFAVLRRYYRRAFGQVRMGKQALTQEIWSSLIFGVLGITAFVVDSSEVLPVSAIGVVFALGLWVDYLRFNRPVEEKFLSYYPWFATGLFVISILPAFGLDALWTLFGIGRPTSGALVLIGALMVMIGLLGHLFLVQALPPRMEAGHDESV